MYEYLKGLFGKDEEGKEVPMTFEELIGKIEANADIKLVNLSEGGYVSKAKFDAKETELNGVREQLATANGEIQSYRDMDIDGIKKSVSDWKEKYDAETAQLNAKLEAQERKHNEEMFLRNYDYTSKAAKNGIASMFVEQKFELRDGKFIGAEEYMKSLMEDDDYKEAFVRPKPQIEEKKNIDDKTKKPQFASATKQNSVPPKKISLAELMKQKNENPNMAVSFDS